MNPKWILAVMALVFIYGVVKKMSEPDVTPNVGVALELPGESHSGANPDANPDANPGAAERAWPPVIDGAVTAAPTVNYYVVLDGSGSMSRRECADDGRKIEVALESVRKFIDAIPAEANVGLAVFDRRDLSERVPIAANNRDEIADALKKVRAGEGTPLKSAIRLGYKKLTEQASRQLGYGEYHLVVVTDGKPDPASEDPTAQVNDILAQSPVVLHTIGFCIDDDHVLNQPGRAYYVSASNPGELQQGLQSVLAEAPTFDATKFEQ